MHELLIKYFNQDINSEEKKQLFALIETDVELKKEFIAAQNINALSSLLPRDFDEPEAIGKLLDFKQARRKQSFRMPYKHILGYAAAICIAVFSTWIVTNDSHSPADEIEAIAYEEFSTPSGQRALVKLQDGTTVWLNARSTLRYPNHFAKGERRVELDGEAFFEVRHDDKIPFVVTTEKLDIKVLGTKFNVFAYKGRNEFNTSLMEGSVKIYKAEDEAGALFVQPNEHVELIGNKLVKRAIDNADFLLWKDGIYAFDDVAFSQIIRKLELYYDITIQVNDRKLDSYKFSGKFRQRDGVESVLRTLQKVYYFSYKKDEERNKITIQ